MSIHVEKNACFWIASASKNGTIQTEDKSAGLLLFALQNNELKKNNRKQERKSTKCGTNKQEEKKGKESMDKLLDMGMKWKKKDSLISQTIGGVMTAIPTAYAKQIERAAENQELPPSWEEKDAELLREKIWKAYQEKQKQNK